MIKKILVALDPDDDTPIATRYSADVAGRSGAEVSGLAIIDTNRIAAEIGPGGAVGSMHYQETSRKRMLDEARETARSLVHTFDETLEEADLAHNEYVKEGSAIEQLLEEIKYNDLLVVGRSPHFFYNRPEKSTDTLARIVKHSIAPSLVVCERYEPVKHVLVAYDGSEPSARTMHRFAQLQPFGTDLLVEIVYARTSDTSRQRDASNLLLERASSYLRAHGFDHIRHSAVDGERPASSLIEHADRIHADMVVAGAHSVSAVRRVAFGSTTHELLTACMVPLFIFH